MPTRDFLEQIYNQKKRQLDHDFQSDLAVLVRERLNIIRDLRSLSPNGWNSLAIPLSIQDALQSEIY